MSWCTQKNKNELPNFASKPWGGNLRRHRQNSYQSSIVFFMDWFSSKGWEGTSQKQWSFELNWCPSWLDMCGSFPLKMSDQKSEKKLQRTHLVTCFFGVAFWKRGEHTNLPRVFHPLTRGFQVGNPGPSNQDSPQNFRKCPSMMGMNHR